MLELSLPIPNAILRRETATIVRRSYPPYGLASPTISERSLGYSKISIRRLSVRPSVLRVVTGHRPGIRKADRLKTFPIHATTLDEESHDIRGTRGG